MSNSPNTKMATHNTYSELQTLFPRVDDQIPSHTGIQQTNHTANHRKPRGRPAKLKNQIGTQLY